MSELKNVQQIENAAQVVIEIRTASGSMYKFSLPDADGFRDITAVQLHRAVRFRGKIHGIAMKNPPKKIGDVLEDKRFVVPTNTVKVGDSLVILREDGQFASTTEIASIYEA
ncbi:MAG: hypothetical protein WCV85_03435 [Patescibacteria group bacterium]